MKQWRGIKKVLCIRPDNMGDVIMNGPAFRAMKETFGCHLALLTSSMGAPIARYMKEIDEVIISDLPWVKADRGTSPQGCADLIERLKADKFDAAIIFTVYSQNPLPSAMLAYIADIPLRLAYCRENPYDLLTHWIPDQEPYTFIKHQVQRDLDLVKAIGGEITNDQLFLEVPDDFVRSGVIKDFSNTDYIVIHPSVSEEKRKYPAERWANLIKQLRRRTDGPLLITGGKNESAYAEEIVRMADIADCHNLVGNTSLDDFVHIIRKASLLVSVNTSAVHIASALQTPVVVLYALTNPQHTPWKVSNEVFYFPVKESLKSRNEVIRYVSQQTKLPDDEFPSASMIAEACTQIRRAKKCLGRFRIS